MENSRLLPENKVLVYDEGKKIAQYSREMPVPAGKLLASSGGRCAVRIGDVSLIAEDQSKFAIETDANYRYISVTQGTVYFGLTDESRSMMFLTPKGGVATQQVLLNAAADNRFLEGYVRVTEKTSEIGVLDGGAMIVASRDGEQKLNSGQSIFLAQAEEAGDPQQTERQTTAGPPGWWGSMSAIEKVGVVTIGAIGVGGVAWAIADDDDDDDDASPSSP
ncbi:MAG: hypothetical protein KFF46_07440 [Desulfobacterales bacterium]|nr:hypothetical protein [Desulfobacterales bacterium]